MAGLLPTLEKFGKHCVLLATPATLHFIQRSIDTDGMQVIVSAPWVRPASASPLCCNALYQTYLRIAAR